jgi:mono/diheme cytochrome c family protein
MKWAAIALMTGSCVAMAALADEVSRAEYRWRNSPYGAMLERILPPSIAPAQLPQPQAAGARLAAAYCVQCHYLPNPAMHNAARWKSVVERMVWRMQGRGNLGTLMREMMADVKAPSAAEEAQLVQYLQSNAQREINRSRYDLRSQRGRIFSIACAQCHVLPDPKRHTADEWPQIVERMKRNIAWANRVTGDPNLRTTPELDTAEIVRFLQRNSRAR